MNLKKIAENLLFTLNIFILVIVFFKSSLYVPGWMQPVGRLHPLILHFPIVLLILTLTSVFVYFKNESYQQIKQQLTNHLLLLGAIFSALTVISGLFLSNEEGYEGNALQLHMWTGIAIVFATSLIYWFRENLWKHIRVYKIIAIVSIFLIAATGHYGATLTHGEGFLFPQAKKTNQPVDLQDALVFDHIIMPVIQEKCISCHNQEKSKGNLMLIDSLSFLKGGKTGKLFNRAKPELSLILKRIHLPEEDEKRMPPTGKPQLTNEELTLLELWIQSGALFTTKLVDLPASDSLRQLASEFLDTQETFDFAAADEATVEKLNDNYRLVSPLAKESPALAVKLYNPAQYSTQKLQELLPVKTQVISLDLNKLPVKDADLKIIAEFKNLRRLNLNFTGVTGNGLKELSGLAHLKNLYLSGTNINYASLKELKSIKQLQQVAIWNNPVSAEDVVNLKKENPSIVFITGFSDDDVPTTLTPPQLTDNTVVFRDTLALALRHPIAGVEIRYTTDGTDPDSIQSPVLKEGVNFMQNTTVKAKAYRNGWNSSEIAEFNFLKNAHTPDSMQFIVAPYENYRGDGVYTFFDGELGGYNIYRYTKNKWVGFKERNLEMMMVYKQPRSISSVSLHTFISVGDRAFPPAIMEIWAGTNADNMKLISTIKPAVPGEKDPRKLENITSHFKAENITHLKIIAQPMKLPAWFVADKGNPSQLMIDEILIN